MTQHNQFITLLHQGKFVELQHAIESDDGVHDALVYALYCISLWYTPHHDSALNWLTTSYPNLDGQTREIVQMSIALIHQDFEQLHRLATDLINSTDATSHPIIRHLAYHSAGASSLFPILALETASDRLSTALTIAQSLQNINLISMSAYWLGETYSMRGLYQQARTTYQLGMMYPSVTYVARITGALAINYARADEYDSALYFAQQAIQHATTIDDLKAQVANRRNLAQIHLLYGEVEQAQHILDQLDKSILNKLQPVAFHNFYKLYEVAQAEAWIQSSDYQQFATWWSQRGQLLLIQAKRDRLLDIVLSGLQADYALATQDYERASVHVAQLNQVLDRYELNWLWVKLLQLRLYWEQVNYTDGIPFLEKLLSSITDFDKGLLRSAPIQNILRDAKMRGVNTSTFISTPTTTVWETSLTRQEYHILTYLADATLNNQDIASALSLSINTIKWHIRNIYSKLGVNDRQSAIIVARQKHWLSD